MRTLLAALSLALSLPAVAGDTDQAAAVEAMRQPNAVLIDVRTPEEVAEGTIPGARNIGYEAISQRIAEVAPDKDTPIVLYCRSGNMSADAAKILVSLGYTNVYNLSGGMIAWREAGYPLLQDGE